MPSSIPNNANGEGIRSISSNSSRQFVVAPDGQTIEVPANYYSAPANNGNGIVYRPIGSATDANSIRVMGTTSYAPNGYAVFYNSYGQPINPLTGRTLSPLEWHFLFGK